jgi:predicted DNA-binding transcriptional regulator YafY
MSKYDRLLHILNLLRSRRSLRAKDLAKECEVTERTVYRDILSLSSANVPIYFDDGYKFLSDAFLPPLNLTREEFVVTHLGLNSEIVSSDKLLMRYGKQVAAKLIACLPETIRDECKQICNCIEISCPHKAIKSHSGLMLGTLIQAVASGKKITLRCGQVKQNIERVEVGLLKYEEGNWYLTVSLPNENITLPLDQLKSITLCT